MDNDDWAFLPLAIAAFVAIVAAGAILNHVWS